MFLSYSVGINELTKNWFAATSVLGIFDLIINSIILSILIYEIFCSTGIIPLSNHVRPSILSILYFPSLGFLQYSFFNFSYLFNKGQIVLHTILHLHTWQQLLLFRLTNNTSAYCLKTVLHFTKKWFVQSIKNV